MQVKMLCKEKDLIKPAKPCIKFSELEKKNVEEITLKASKKTFAQLEILMALSC
jgi:hypothetical protein